jgi:hypothetical protein
VRGGEGGFSGAGARERRGPGDQANVCLTPDFCGTPNPHPIDKPCCLPVHFTHKAVTEKSSRSPWSAESRRCWEGGLRPL